MMISLVSKQCDDRTMDGAFQLVLLPSAPQIPKVNSQTSSEVARVPQVIYIYLPPQNVSATSYFAVVGQQGDDDGKQQARVLLVYNPSGCWSPLTTALAYVSAHLRFTHERRSTRVSSIIIIVLSLQIVLLVETVSNLYRRDHQPATNIHILCKYVN